MSGSGRSAPLRAACALAAVAWAIAARPEPSPPASCPCPAEVRAEAGWTVWVGCNAGMSPHPLRGPSPALFGWPLDLNRADARVLETLPGIGPVRAGQIVAERARAPFASAAEVVRVRGIGPATARGLEGWVAAGPGSQKSFQLLSIPCENSYTDRAGGPARPRSR